MRIISGKHKGKKINSVDGNTARPTSDFVREMVFSTLHSLIESFEDKMILDLYSGSGAVGFEAISRGVSDVTFVDASKKSISIIISNIESLNCSDISHVSLKKVDSFLTTYKGHQFDLIFSDPPYCKNLINNTLRLILENKLLKDEGILILEHSKEEQIESEFKKYVFKEKMTSHIIISFVNFKDFYADL